MNNLYFNHETLRSEPIIEPKMVDKHIRQLEEEVEKLRAIVKGKVLMVEDGSVDITAYIRKGALVENVDFFPAGAVPPNPTELLMSERLEALVNVAKENYDCIIFDATPAFSVADAEVLSRVAELLLFVVRVGVQDKDFLKDLERMHQNQRLSNLAIVVNDADIKSKLHYGYGYGYGYGTKDSECRRKFSLKRK